MIGRQIPRSFMWFISSKTQISRATNQEMGQGSPSNVPEVAKLGGGGAESTAGGPHAQPHPLLASAE